MNILIVIGTRPEAIKMLPLYIKFKSDTRFDIKLCVTAQHREMLDQVLNVFNVIPDFDLDIMKKSQDLTSITTQILNGLSEVFLMFKPSLILVHGDTATTLSTTISAYYHKIAIGHVEAGLRTWNKYSPWPEEGNRKVASALVDFHFAPTQTAKNNLLRENIASDQIFITGNTVIDSLFDILNRLKNNPLEMKNLSGRFSFLNEKRKMILVTGHRRESFGDGFDRICKSLKIIASEFKDVDIVYPVHLNPNVKEPVLHQLSKINNIYLIEPQEYVPFVYLMNRSYIILTDSGGIQEEAPSIGKPVLVMRDTTERPEAIASGAVKLVGTDIELITSNLRQLITSNTEYLKMSNSKNPYGDGFACDRIIDIISSKFNLQ